MGAYGRVRFALLCTVYILKIASYDKFVLASTISRSDVSRTTQSTKVFLNVTSSVVSRSPTRTVGSPNRTAVTVQASPSTKTAVSSDAASCKSTVLLQFSQATTAASVTAETSMEPTMSSTVKPVTSPSVNVDGCKHYKVLNGIDRAQGYTLPPQQKCDSDLELGWYRFHGLAGHQMADKCVSMLRCSTVAPGWLSGGHPTVADDVVVRKVCYHWFSCCGHSDDIHVRNCGAFFVYELKKPPSCYLRYCGNGSAEYMCPALPAPSNGLKLGCPENSTVYNDTVCQFSCNDGYIGSGSQQRRCQRNATWSGEAFTCQMVTCPALTAPSNGTRFGCPTNATLYYDTVCQFSCNDGYIGSGPQARRCQHNGTWSGQNFTCQIVTCPSLPSSPNSVRYGCTGNSSEYVHDTVCGFSCVDGYKAIGSRERRCQQNGLWSGEEFSCQPVTCPTLSPPTNGELLGCNITDMFYNTVCGFSCDEGFEGKGSTVRRCTENGTWSGTDLVCTGLKTFYR